jgi:aminobenzoyl-glutamate utilization protein A
VAQRLSDLGYQVALGREVLDAEARMGLPSAEALDTAWRRARDWGAPEPFLSQVRDGFTAVVGTLRHGDGPTLGLRFDMDALSIPEAVAPEHRPCREGFASLNPGVMHACGHDAHTAIGMGLAKLLKRLEGEWQGAVKLIFQPAEEGVRGARAMVEAGVLDDVDRFVATHVHTGWALDEIMPDQGGFAATQKFDAVISGAPSHAGGRPEGGHNALLAAAAAVTNLYAIPRHRDGATRVNVGRLNAGVGRNVIPPTAHLVAEVRGATTDLSDYMYQRARAVLQSAADMYGCELTVREMGAAQSAESDPAWADAIAAVGERLGCERLPYRSSGGSEDASYMMRCVQARGGLAAYLGVGADLQGISFHTKDRDRGLGAHTSYFDIDERALSRTVALLAAVVCNQLGPK